MQAFVTGSTGLLGSHLVPELLRRGHAVTGLARSRHKAEALFGDRAVEVVEGDVRTPEAFEAYLKGCDVVFHLAAYFREYKATSAERDLLHEVNVQASIRLAEAARRQGVSTFVFVSSAGVLRPEATGDTDEPPAYDVATPNLYFRSKIAAEKALLRRAGQHDDLRITVVRPTMMLGPRDLGPTPAGRFVVNYLEGNIPVVLPAKVLVSDARDVAHALVEAAVRGRDSVGYTLGGHLLSFGEMMTALEAASGVPAPTRRPPYVVASIMLGIRGVLARLTGQQMPLRRQDLKRMRRLTAPDMWRAQQELDYRCRPLQETINDTVRWLQENAVAGPRRHPVASPKS